MRIQNKLFLTLLLTSFAVIAILAILMQWSIGHGMVDYINKREINKLEPVILDIAAQYGQYQNWNWLDNNPKVLRRILFENLLLRHNKKEYADAEYHHHDLKRKHKKYYRKPYPDIVIYDVDDKAVVSLGARAKNRTRIAINWQDSIIGWISIPQHKNIMKGFELVFIEQQRKTFWIMSAVIMLLAALIAYPLARHLVRPMEQLKESTNRLISGDFSQRLPVNRNDELGGLARDFNELANTLNKNETSRKRWVADISHELRTPLAILSGEVEAMLDGVRIVSVENIQSIKEEVAHLTKLVDDLYLLTQADIGGLNYRKTNMDLVELVQNKIKSYHSSFEQNGLELSFKTYKPEVLIWADSTRISQLLDNLLTNSLRYTSEGGRVDISLDTDTRYINLLVQDSEPGVSDDELEYLFDYLYRTEQSRNRETGGSGLGLAICKRIAEGHNGDISARGSTLGGLTVHVKFPLDIML